MRNGDYYIHQVANHIYLLDRKSGDLWRQRIATKRHACDQDKDERYVWVQEKFFPEPNHATDDLWPFIEKIRIDLKNLKKSYDNQLDDDAFKKETRNNIDTVGRSLEGLINALRIIEYQR